MEPLEVLLFGGFRLRRGDETVPPVPARAARTLLAYLAVNRGIRHPRERLVDRFWPELPANRGRRRLSHTLWQAQDALSELRGDVDYLDVSTDAIGFSSDAPCTVDVEEFTRGLDRARERRSAASSWPGTRTRGSSSNASGCTSGTWKRSGGWWASPRRTPPTRTLWSTPDG